MAGKKVGILIRRSPLKDKKAAEALRMAVGMILRDNEVHVIFSNDGAEVFLGEGPEGLKTEIQRHLDTLVEFDQHIVVEREALEGSRGLTIGEGPTIWQKERILQFLLECDATVLV